MMVESLRNDMLLLAVFMLIGFGVREVIKPLQRLFLPSSLIGGLLLLLLGQQALDVIIVPESFQEIPGVLIDIVLASLVFGVNFDKKKMASYLDYSCITMVSYGMQLCLGVGLGWVLSRIWKGLPLGWGVMGVFSFHGGHGTAAAAAASFENIGIEGNMAVGMVLSTFGLVIAMTVGTVLVNYGVRKGWGTFVKNSESQPDSFFGGTLPERERKPVGHLVTTSISINHLALQASWLLVALCIGRGLFHLLGTISPAFSHLPNVLHGVFGGAVLWFVLKKTKLDRYVDLKTIKMISGFLLEVVIFTAMATLDLKFISAYIVPVLIYTVIICGLTIPLVFCLSYRYLETEWFEKACMAFGAATGNTSTGLALVRMVDPDSRSSAGDTHGVYSAIMSWKDIFVGLTPLWLTNGVALTMGVGFVMMVGFMVLVIMISGKRNRK